MGGVVDKVKSAAQSVRDKAKSGIQSSIDFQENTTAGSMLNPAARLRKTVSGLDLQGDTVADKAYSGLNQIHQGFVREVDPGTRTIDYLADRAGDALRPEIPEPPEQPEVPSREDAAERARQDRLQEQRVTSRRRAGRSGTILTGGQGLGSGGTRQRSLLGG